MRSCRRLNARNIVFRVIEERRGKKEKKREKKGVKKCIRRYPDYSIHGQSPAFRSDSHDRGMKKRSWKVFRPIVFSFFPTRSEERSTSRFSFSVRCFARETSEIHRLLRMKFDLELRGNYFLSSLFRNDFPTGFKTVLFPFENKRNLRKGSICLIDIRFCEISQKYRIQISNRGNLLKSSFLRNR